MKSRHKNLIKYFACLDSINNTVKKLRESMTLDIMTSKQEMKSTIISNEFEEQDIRDNFKNFEIITERRNLVF